MRKRFLSIFLSITLILLLFPNHLKADEKLDWSDKPYIDTYINLENKTIDEIKLSKYIDMLNKGIELTPEMRGYINDNNWTRRGNIYGPYYFTQMNDDALYRFFKYLSLEDPWYLSVFEDFWINTLYGMDDTAYFSNALSYLCLRIYREKNNNVEYMPGKLFNKLYYDNDKKIEYINKNAKLAPNYFEDLRKRSSVKRVYEAFIKANPDFPKASWYEPNFTLTPVVVGGYSDGFNPKTTPFLNIFCNANFTYDEAIVSPPAIKAYVYNSKNKLCDILLPSYSFRSNNLGSFIFTIKNNKKYLKPGKFRIKVTMTANNFDKNLYAKSENFLNVTYKKNKGKYRRMPILPLAQSEYYSYFLKNNKISKFFVSDEKVVKKIVKIVKNREKKMKKRIDTWDLIPKLSKNEKNLPFKKNKSLYQKFMNSEALFSFSRSPFPMFDYFREDGKLILYDYYNKDLKSLMEIAGISPQYISKYMKRYSKKNLPKEIMIVDDGSEDDIDIDSLVFYDYE